jgi:uncharacterized phiE125 gp8 family phage protein
MAAVLTPGAAPVPLEEVKAFLRIGGSEEDALLTGLVRSAGELCEAFTRVVPILREVEEVLPARPAWTRLSQTPVRAILAVSALAADGEATALAPDAYAIDIDAAGEGWVRMPGGSAGRVLVRYQAGQASDWNGVPAPLRHGIMRMAAHLYTHRDGAGERGPPAAVTALWLPYRRLRLR